jgi:hypothetical protein
MAAGRRTASRRIIIAGLCALVLVSILAAASLRSAHVFPKARSSTLPAIKLEEPRTLAELLALKPADLERVDVARRNLLCAEGLPGAESLNVDASLAALGQWADHAKREINRHLYRFRANPAEFDRSEGYFRMLMMSVVVYEDFGVRYNPERISAPADLRADDHFFADSRDVLLHGLVGERRMGTCSSMPVFYVALARRLGYPVKLVATKAHLFMRWESPSDRFDMEATGKGMNRYDDEHFRQWPFPISDAEIKEEGYLKSMTAAEELSVFLSIRAACLMEAGRVPEAVSAFESALRLAPDWKGNRLLLANAQEKQARGWKPSGLPPGEDIDAIVRWAEMNRRAGPDLVPDPSPFRRIPQP